MDDFDVIIGMEFMMGQKSILIPTEESLLIMRNDPNVVQGKMQQMRKLKGLSNLQLKTGLMKGYPSFLEIPLP